MDAQVKRMGIIALSLILVIIGAGVILDKGSRLMRPVLQEAWIVSRVDDQEVATTVPKVAAQTSQVTLYAVVKARAAVFSRSKYYGDAGLVMIDGETQAPIETTPWDPVRTELKILWFKVEPRAVLDEREVLRPELVEYKEFLCPQWGFSWSARADVIPRGLNYKKLWPWHRDDVGTMHFKIHVELKKTAAIVLKRLKTPGAAEARDGIAHPGTHRVTVLPQFDPAGCVQGLFHVPFAAATLSEEQRRTRAAAFAPSDPLGLLLSSRIACRAEVPEASIDKLVEAGHLQVAVRDIQVREDGALAAGPGGEPLVWMRDLVPGDFLYQEDRIAVLLGDGSATGAVSANGTLDVLDTVIGLKGPIPLEMALRDAAGLQGDLYRWSRVAGKPRGPLSRAE